MTARDLRFSPKPKIFNTVILRLYHWNVHLSIYLRIAQQATLKEFL
jgi:hypothetical protein